MTYILSLDPGQNTGAALGYYDAITPYRLVERYQIHGGLEGFVAWCMEGNPFTADEVVVESFRLREENEFSADLTPVHIEGAIRAMAALDSEFWPKVPIIYQPPSDKGSLIGYPRSAVTKAQRQRVRFDFLDRFGLFKAGTENDDSNDAITHALVCLKRRKHGPTTMALWPPPSRILAA